MGSPSDPESSALHGLKVVELAQLVSGPMAGSLLADLGAEVVHVEDPGSGDPLRHTRGAKDGAHLWWKVAARNKRSVTCDLRTARGQDLARSLAGWADVLVTNMRPTTLNGWGLDFDSLRLVNATIVVLHVTGFGLTSTRRDEPGFGKVGEAMSGVVHLTGFPDGPPVHTGFSHADTLAGVFGVIGVQAALYRRSVDPGFAGELVDVALFEPLFRLVEWQLIEAEQLGVAPARQGNQLEGAKGSVVNLYEANDGRFVTVSAGTVRSARVLARMLGAEVAEDCPPDALADLDLDGRTRRWVAERAAAEAVAELAAHGVVASRIYDAADILTDPTYAERQDVVEVADGDFGTVSMPDVVPRLTSHRGWVRRPAPALGADNDLVYGTYLGIGSKELAALRADGVI